MGSFCGSMKNANKNVKANKKNDQKNKNDTSELNNTENDKSDDNNVKHQNSKKDEENNEKKNSSDNSDSPEKNQKKKSNNNKINSDIIVKYLCKGEVEFEELFKTNENISSLFDILLEKKSRYEEYDLISNDYLSLLSKLNEKIGKIFPDKEEIELKLFYLGLDINEDVKKEYEKTNSLLGMPLFDLGGDIGLLIFDAKKKNLTSELIKDNKLSIFNHLSSFCNAKNILYISGGDSSKSKEKTESINKFFSIDLFDKKSIKTLPNLTHPRAWHSMIFIPNKYIFIIGGGTKNVELYDIEAGKITEDSEMIEVRNESTLCCMNNAILYAFCGVNVDGIFLTTVERCNLKRQKRTWSYVEYTTSDNVLFEECFYVSCYFSDTSLILFSTNEDEKNEHCNILFDLEDEENAIISLFECENKLIDVCPEKMFYPIGNNCSVLLPLVGTTAKIYEIDENMKLIAQNYPDALKNIME